MDNYQVIEDDTPDKTVCHIINVSHTDRLFEVKFKDIKKRAAKTFGTNEKEINIIKDDSQGWIFTNSNGDLLGKLNEEDASVYEAHEIVYDLINKKRGDIDRADKLLDQLEGSEADLIW